MDVWVPVASLLVFGLAAYATAKMYRTFVRRPSSYPTAKYLAELGRSRPTAPRLVCLGASITQGDIGASYVSLLERRLAGSGWAVLNAGINGDLAVNILARLGDVIAAQPTVVTLQIGTNDINASMSPQNYQNYVRMGKITQPPTFADYQANVTEIVRRLRTETQARVAVLSIPLITEDLDHEVNQRGDRYSAHLQEVASELNVGYLALRERQKAYLTTTAKKGGQPYENTGRLGMSAIVWSLLGLSWDKIAERYGNRLTIDNIHSNSISAQMIADLIEGFVRNGHEA